jgi:tetratricopeptide (TPR) repeat protein
MVSAGRRLVRALPVALVLAGSGCRHLPGGGGSDGNLSGSVRDGKALLESGQLDAALAELEKSPDDPDALYYQGRVWAKKAESAPLPTPPPAPSPAPRGWQPPPAPELKPEEVRAAQLYEKAIAARPDHAPTQLALAELLAPHAAHQHDLAEEAARHKGAPAPAAPLPVDVSADRVIRAYQFAMQADPADTVPVEELIRFGKRVGRFDAAEAGFKEMIHRKKEKETAAPLARYGDFLAEDKKDPLAAIEQYRQALIWVPEDDATRGKVAAIYLKMAAEAFAQQQYAVTDDHLKDASKYITDRTSAQAQTLRDYQARLHTIRR